MSTTLFPFGDCKNAALQQIRNVQGHGVLVAINVDSSRIEYCSANSAELLGTTPAELLGRTGSQWLSSRWPGLSSLASGKSNLESRGFAGPEPLTVVGHRCGAHQIFEFERANTASRHWWNHSTRTRFIEQLTSVHSVEQCREILITWVFDRSGFDRVLLYRFLPDWHGEVVQERCRGGVEGYLGLRFPASDLPPNARQLFTLNWQRSIADVDSDPSPILSWNNDEHPLDLTYSMLRSAHPVHIQYLKNMGVQSSFTLSMVVNGKLWALVACHHLSTRLLAIEDCLAYEEMARLVSLHLASLLGLEQQRSEADMRRQLAMLQSAIGASGGNEKFALSHNLAAVRRTFASSGAWLRFEGEDFFSGLVPEKLSLGPLRDILEGFPREEVCYYDSLPEALREYRALAANASGLLFVPLGGADFLALVRPEVIETVNWAGRPESQAGATLTLTPRSSFAAWSQKVRNTAERWTELEVEFSAKLRSDILLFIEKSRLEKTALHDPLTGLPNRFLFERRLQREVRSSMERPNVFAIHMIDLDRFKQVNDTFGHAAGDQVLTLVGERLTSLVRKEDTVARLGGDEFAILQTGLDEKGAAIATAEQIVRVISEPYQIDGQSVQIGASIGISICPSDTVEESELLECADLALYQVKRSGRNAAFAYAPAMRNNETRNDKEDERLVQAFTNGDFRMVYQPIFDARSGELRGLEAYLRWSRIGRAELTAHEIVPVFEQKRLTPALSEWVMTAVFAQYHEWLRQGLPMVPVTVNIGDAEFATHDLLGQIKRLAARFETGWQWLRLDIDERSLLTDVGYAIRKLNTLRDAGVAANLDNFGRGFVPLGYLTQLPFRGIKLEGNQFQHKSHRQYFNALFNIAQSIAQVSSAQLTVTRIETREMREMLRSQRVDLMQGYAIGPPVEAAQAADWLRQPELVNAPDIPIEAQTR